MARPGQRRGEHDLKKVPAKRRQALPHQNPNSRETILVAALKAFARGGFDGASLPKIAEMATVAPPLIHYYFGSKDNLWRETVDYSLGELRREASAISSATRTLAPLDRLRALLQAITQFAIRWPDHFGMVMAEARSESGRYSWIHENYTGVLFADVVQILQDAKSQGQIKDVAINHLAFILIGGILVYFTIDPPIGDKDDITKQTDEYLDLLFSMIVEGISPKPRSR
jgi:AcrR family transcriptional regulator